MEKDKLVVTTLLEDFKARWQELLNFENENSRWQTLYVTALMLVIGWVLSNSGEVGKYRTISEIFRGDNSFFVLSLALVNAIYTLAMACKGYQIQEIAQYLYKNIGTVISRKTELHFNSWEEWRRDEKGRPLLIRVAYYPIVGLLPTAVSTTILGLYYYHESKLPDHLAQNIFSVFVSVFVLLSFVIAVSTTRMNKRWTEILAEKTRDDER